MAEADRVEGDAVRPICGLRDRLVRSFSERLWTRRTSQSERLWTKICLSKLQGRPPHVGSCRPDDSDPIGFSLISHSFTVFQLIFYYFAPIDEFVIWLACSI